MKIIIYKMFIWVGISSDIWLEIMATLMCDSIPIKISDSKSEEMNILNTIIF